MIAPLVFVGERRSPTAIRKGWRWQDGRLAAKQLFDALTACGLDPSAQFYVNLFDRGGLATVRQARAAGLTLVAMGRTVQTALASRSLPYIALIHPAARGAIRRKATYLEHVRENALARSAIAPAVNPGTAR